MTLPTSDSPNIPEQDTVATAILPEENKKVCADCEHLIGKRYNTADSEAWRCGHPNNVYSVEDSNGWSDDYVTGLRHRRFKISPNIYHVRERHCEGKWWSKYQEPERVYTPDPTIGGKEATQLTEEVFNKDELQASAQAAKERVEEMKRKKRGY